MELLGVLVIISLIALITVPTVSNMLKNSKQNVVKTSAINYIEAVETYLKASALDKEKTELSYNNTYNINKDTIIDSVTYPALNNLVEIDGNPPTDGTITINDNYTVVTAEIIIDKYKIIYNGAEKIVSINPV